MNFEELKSFFDRIVEYQSHGRTGPFSLSINNRGKKYFFETLKVNASNNPDYFGFGLNHSRQEQFCKRSKYHDEEDICIDILKEDFKSAKLIDANSVEIKTKFETINVVF